jgi:hypothetical protein
MLRRAKRCSSAAVNPLVVGSSPTRGANALFINNLNALIIATSTNVSGCERVALQPDSGSTSLMASCA